LDSKWEPIKRRINEYLHTSIESTRRTSDVT